MTSWFGAGLVAVERRHAAAAFLTVPGLAVAHALLETARDAARRPPGVSLELVALLLVNREPREAAPEVTHETFGPFTEREIDLADRILLLRSRPPFRACSIDALAERAPSGDLEAWAARSVHCRPLQFEF